MCKELFEQNNDRNNVSVRLDWNSIAFKLLYLAVLGCARYSSVVTD